HLTVLMLGGIGADGLPIDGSQVRALNTATPTNTWFTKSLPGGPSARSGHAATWEAHGLTWTIHGGLLADGSLSNDVYVLDFKHQPDPIWTYYPQSGGTGGRTQHTLVFDGHVGEGEMTHLVDARIPELFNPGLATTLPGSMTAYGPATTRRLTAYPMLHALPERKVPPAGRSSDSRTYSPCQSTAGWGAAIPGTQTFFGGASVQYVPGRYMKASGFDGGGNVHGLTQTLDGTTAPLAWTAGTKSALLPRTNHNLLVLPQGQALGEGGRSGGEGSRVAGARWMK